MIPSCFLSIFSHAFLLSYSVYLLILIFDYYSLFSILYSLYPVSSLFLSDSISYSSSISVLNFEIIPFFLNHNLFHPLPQPQPLQCASMRNISSTVAARRSGSTRTATWPATTQTTSALASRSCAMSGSSRPSASPALQSGPLPLPRGSNSSSNSSSSSMLNTDNQQRRIQDKSNEQNRKNKEKKTEIQQIQQIQQIKKHRKSANTEIHQIKQTASAVFYTSSHTNQHTAAAVQMGPRASRLCPLAASLAILLYYYFTNEKMRR